MLFSLTIALSIAHSSITFAAQALDFKPCLTTAGARQIDSLCAFLDRPEDPSKPDGEQVRLQIVKLPSRAPDPEPDAFTLIQGGPGGSSISMVVSYAGLLEGIRAERDVLVVDQRGTGRSNILRCPEIDPALLAGEYDLELIKQESLDCIDSIDADLAFYTTSIAVQDLDAVRQAAGYPQLTVYGVSYGTRVAQHYLRRFPDKNRLVILDGVVPIGLNLAGGEIARQSQASFDQLASRCKASEQCNTQFGDLQVKLTELLQSLKAKPIELRLADPISGEMIDKTLTRDDLLGVLRLMAYSTEDNALLPLIIAEAHAGNYHPLAAQSLMISADFLKEYAIGMNNTVMCSEDAPFVKPSDLAGLETTYFGTKMSEAMAATCSVWPKGPVDDDFLEKFDSNVPVLILSGETDPITPPKNGDEVHAMFSNSKHIVMPAHGHGVFHRGCLTQLVSNFVADGSIAEINSECVKRQKPMPFFITPAGPKP